MSDLEAVFIARVSTEEQKEAGNSLPAQVHRLKTLCDQKGFVVIKEWQLDESAFKEDRLEFEKILDFIRKHPRPLAVCTDKIDRLQRNFNHWQVLEELRKSGKIELHFYSDNLVIDKNSPAADLFRWSIGVSAANYYSASISDNVKRAFEQKWRRGEWTGRCKLGYRNIEVDEKKTLELDAERAPFIKQAFELYSTGNYSDRTIHEVLVAKGFTNNKKPFKPVSLSQLNEILRDSFYYGEMYSPKRNQRAPHRYDRIIDKWLFDKCQQVRDSRRTTKSKLKGKEHIFSGLVVCANCGRIITTDSGKKNGNAYLFCNNYKNCGGSFVNEKVALAQVEGIFKSISLPRAALDIITQELKKTFNAEQEHNQALIVSLRKQYDAITEKIAVMYDDRLAGRITPDEYDILVKKYKQKQADINLQIELLTTADEGFLISSSYLLELAHQAHDLFASSKTPQKRQLINFVFSNLKLEGKTLIFNLKEPFDAIIQASNVRTGSGGRIRTDDQSINSRPLCR